MLRWAEFRVVLFLGVVVGVLQWWLDVRQPTPYMDELFHVPQAQRYCAGDESYDADITTPPGLYLLPMVFAKVLRSFIPLTPEVVRLSSVSHQREGGQSNQRNCEVEKKKR